MPQLKYEDVERAARDLASRGERVTLEGVRSAIGYGSFSTIRRHLDTWRAKLSAEPDPSILSPHVPADLSTAFKGVWDLAISRATDLFAQQRDELLARTADALASLEARNADLIDSKVALQQANDRIADHQAVLAGLNTRLDAEALERKGMQQAFAEERARSEAAHQSEIASCGRDLDAAHRRIEALLALSARAESEITLWKERHAGDVAFLNKRVAEESASKLAATDLLEAATARVNSLTSQMAVSISELKTSALEATNLKAEASKLLDRITQVTAQLEGERASRIRAEADRAFQAAALVDSRRKIDQLEADVRSLVNELATERGGGLKQAVNTLNACHCKGAPMLYLEPSRHGVRAGIRCQSCQTIVQEPEGASPLSLSERVMALAESWNSIPEA